MNQNKNKVKVESEKVKLSKTYSKRQHHYTKYIYKWQQKMAMIGALDNRICTRYQMKS